MISQILIISELLFLVKEDIHNRETVSLYNASDEMLEERWCRYTLLQGTIPILIGITEVPQGMDMDDAFPPFHASNYALSAKEELAMAIRDGGLLIAESNFEPRSFLAYRLNDPNYWYGREKTLKYLGVTDFRPAC